MSIIVWLVLGLVAGWIANMIMSGGRGGIVADLVLGVVGAFVGGWLGGLLLNTDVINGFNLTSILFAVIGAIIVVGIYRAVTGQAVRQ